jgi:5-guanidino-2-oxopentanoate decarboxylase
MARSELSIGEAIVPLLEAYGVDTVFGIPGVHNVEMYRALPRSGIRHILPRHEQGAGFMADGYARATGKPGVCFIITGPGLTNIMTPLGQAHSDSVPVLVIASTLDVADAAQGRGRLHEMQSQRGAAATVTRRAATAYSARDVQDLIAESFAAFATVRPRPDYIEVPIDVLKADAGTGWQPRALPRPATPHPDEITLAVDMLKQASNPVIVAGGGARHAGNTLISIAEATGAIIFTTVAGKGAVPDSHPLNAGALLPQPAATRIVMHADLVLAVGTEISETDLWYQTFDITSPMIRIDLDPASLARPYAASLPIRADANASLALIADGLKDQSADLDAPKARVTDLAETVKAADDEERAILRPVLDTIRSALPQDAVVASDMTLIAYAGNEMFPVEQPDCWLHPVGFGTLGYALPAAIGAKAGVGDRAVVAIAGDYGFQYTSNELGTAAELGQPLPILIWNNNLLGAIHADMVAKGIQPNAVTQVNPNFTALAKAYNCHGECPTTLRALAQAITTALKADRPTIIEMSPEMVKR